MQQLLQQLPQQIVNGISVGSIYALIAVGYTMVYGVLQLINFAHGDVFMVGAIVSYYAATRRIAPTMPWWLHVVIIAALLLGLAVQRVISGNWRRALGRVLPFIILYLALVPGLFIVSAISRWPRLAGTSWTMAGFALLVALLACGALGFTIERLAYRPLRNKPRINSLITAIGISLLLEFGGQNPAVFGPTPQAYPQVVPGDVEPLFRLHLHFGHLIDSVVVLTRVDGLVIGTTLFLMIVLTWIVLKTRTGLALRAVSYRFDTSALMGIDIDRVVSVTFVLGSCLAAVAGMLYAVKYPKVEPLMGLLPGIKAFVAAVFGGIGNIAGAVVGALILGLVEALVVGFLNNGSQYRDAVAFVILIIILLVKPSGLLGKHVVEKV